mgnify:CR=1 FL=1
MRIATQNAYERGLSTLQSRQNELTQLQEQLTSGKRVVRASESELAEHAVRLAVIGKAAGGAALWTQLEQPAPQE